MKDIHDDIDYLAILEKKSINLSEVAVIREEVAPYLASKQQGEYTLDDYYAIPDEYRTELIDGVIYDMATPTIVHQIVCAEIGYRLINYVEKKKGKCIVLPAAVDVQLDCDNKTMVQPDIQVVCKKDKLKKRNIYGAPDFIVEVLSPSTRKKDIYIKKEKYQKAGVREYWMVDTEKERVIVCRFEKSNLSVIYTFKDKVPVGIFDGECKVDFAEVAERIQFLDEDS